MARQYHFEIHRNGSVHHEIYIHDDDSLEMLDVDSGKKTEYSAQKIHLLREMVAWAREHNIHSIEFTEL